MMFFYKRFLHQGATAFLPVGNFYARRLNGTLNGSSVEKRSIFMGDVLGVGLGAVVFVTGLISYNLRPLELGKRP
jgi:hypothetical protein